MFKTINPEIGLNTLCTSNEQFPMDINLYVGKKGSTFKLYDLLKETAILLLSGDIDAFYEDKTVNMMRRNVFIDDATVLHLPCGVKLEIRCNGVTEFIIQQAVNPKLFASKFYTNKEITRQVFGSGVLESTTKRIVSTVFDYDNAPYSNMVLGEIINKPGIWSSYPPHHHPQPEVYFYKFNRPEGFGTCYIGDECFMVHDNSVALIPGGLNHPQNAAPGYAMYYVWMIAHLPNQPWKKDRIFDPKHEWMVEKKAQIIEI